MIEIIVLKYVSILQIVKFVEIKFVKNVEKVLSNKKMQLDKFIVIKKALTQLMVNQIVVLQMNA